MTKYNTINIGIQLKNVYKRKTIYKISNLFSDRRVQVSSDFKFKMYTNYTALEHLFNHWV